MAEQPVRVLLVEDNDGDARLLELALHNLRPGACELKRAATFADAAAAVAGGSFDVLLLDLSLPDSQGVATVERMCQAAPRLPIVVFTGSDDEVLGMETLQRGAQDYLVKGQAEGKAIWRSMRYAIERKRSQLELQAARDELEERVRQRTAELENAITVLGEEVSDRRHAEESLRATDLQMRQVTEAIPEVIWMSAPDLSRIIYVNAAYERVWGRSRESLYADPRSWAEAVLPEDMPALTEAMRKWREQAGYGATEMGIEYRIRRPDGTIVPIYGRAFAIRDDRGKLMSVCGIAEVIAERRGSSLAGRLAAQR